MSDDERVAICKAIAASCMWGQGGIASVIIEELDKVLPTDPSWREVYAANSKAARRESVGVLTDEARLASYLSRGYHLCNYDEDGCSLFNPPPMNGLAMYVSKELAERHPERPAYTRTVPV